MCIDYYSFYLGEQIPAKSKMVCKKCTFQSVLGGFQVESNIFAQK